MDLFGLQEHDDRHDEVERQLRRLVEQVAQLSIDLGVTRMQLRALSLEVAGKANEADIDPALLALNEGIKQARVKLDAAAVAADESWNELSDELSAAVADLRAELDADKPTS